MKELIAQNGAVKVSHVDGVRNYNNDNTCVDVIIIIISSSSSSSNSSSSSSSSSIIINIIM